MKHLLDHIEPPQLAAIIAALGMCVWLCVLSWQNNSKYYRLHNSGKIYDLNYTRRARKVYLALAMLFAGVIVWLVMGEI